MCSFLSAVWFLTSLADIFCSKKCRGKWHFAAAKSCREAWWLGMYLTTCSDYGTISSHISKPKKVFQWKYAHCIWYFLLSAAKDQEIPYAVPLFLDPLPFNILHCMISLLQPLASGRREVARVQLCLAYWNKWTALCSSFARGFSSCFHPGETITGENQWNVWSQWTTKKWHVVLIITT